MTAAEPLVETVVEDARWEAIGLPALAERAARAALAAEGLDPDACEIALLAADDARLAGLNAAFRGRDGATNVLSWPAAETPDPGGRRFLGDLALAYDTCAREAATAGRPLQAHAAHLVVHGVLHLLGHDHAAEPEAEAMEAQERKILESLGLPDPYS